MEKFQELVRVMDATMDNINHDGFITGHNCMNIIHFLIHFQNMDKFLDTKYMEFIKTQMAEAKDKENVRKYVKNILMYPNNKYPPWTMPFIDNKMYSDIREKTKDIKFKIKIIEGKIYAVCVSETKFSDVVFKILNENKIINGYVQNNESCHITLINSDIVYTMSMNKLMTLLKTFNEEFTLNIGIIMQSTSKDYSKFSDFIVLSVSSIYVVTFITEINKTFGLSLDPHLHITCTIKPRDLFYNI